MIIDTKFKTEQPKTRTRKIESKKATSKSKGKIEEPRLENSILKIEDEIQKAGNFEALVDVIHGISGLQGKTGWLSSDSIIGRLYLVKSGTFGPELLPETAGLYKKATELLGLNESVENEKSEEQEGLKNEKDNEKEKEFRHELFLQIKERIQTAQENVRDARRRYTQAIGEEERERNKRSKISRIMSELKIGFTNHGGINAGLDRVKTNYEDEIIKLTKCMSDIDINEMSKRFDVRVEEAAAILEELKKVETEKIVRQVLVEETKIMEDAKAGTMTSEYQNSLGRCLLLFKKSNSTMSDELPINALLATEDGELEKAA